MAKNKIRPLGARVLVQHVETPKEVIKGGIIIPDAAVERPQDAKVIAVGKACELGIKVGDHVLVSKFGGTEVKMDGEKLVILPEKDVLAVFE